MAQSFIAVPTSEHVDTYQLASLQHRETALIGGTLDTVYADVQTAEIFAAATPGLATRDVNTGHSTFHRVGTSGTNVANVKATAGRMKAVHIYNAATYQIFVKFYNSTGPTVGTTAVVNAFGVQAGTAENFPYVRDYSAAISIAILKDLHDTGTNGLDTANVALVDLEYY